MAVDFNPCIGFAKGATSVSRFGPSLFHRPFFLAAPVLALRPLFVYHFRSGVTFFFVLY